MLHGIHPLLSGELLLALDRLGHGDALLIADANYPAHTVGAPVVDVALDAPTVLRAIRTVLPIDTYDDASVTLMTAEPGADVDVQRDLVAAAATEDERVTTAERHAFYALAGRARLVVRTLEARPYGNLLLRKGVVVASWDTTPA